MEGNQMGSGIVHYRSHRICQALRKDGRKSARRQDPDTLRRHNVSPWRLDSVQTLFSQTGWGWGRRPGSALAARLAHCQAGDFARLIHLLGQDEMGGNNEQFAHHRYDRHPFFHSAMN